MPAAGEPPPAPWAVRLASPFDPLLHRRAHRTGCSKSLAARLMRTRTGDRCTAGASDASHADDTRHTRREGTSEKRTPILSTLPHGSCPGRLPRGLQLPPTGIAGLSDSVGVGRPSA